jgi:uncharacterized LabA/DUF88 family protein
MRDPAVDALATDPAARVMVFVDGQNLYKRCRDLFGHPLCHPHLLAQHLAGRRMQHPVVCRYYTGRPNPNIPGESKKARNLDRRLHVMRQAGVTVVSRPLRYHWDWGHRQPLPRPAPGLPGRRVTLYPWQRPQEKGIDLAIALDLLELVLIDRCDVAIVVSLDRDLREIPRAVRNLRPLLGRAVRLEAAVPVPRCRLGAAGSAPRHPIPAHLSDAPPLRPPANYASSARLWGGDAVGRVWLPRGTGRPTLQSAHLCMDSQRHAEAR